MKPNNVRTYILYAIGEVALVMIGILLALQVNNWNEERARQDTVNSYLQQIQEEILIDLERSEQVVRFLERKDELIYAFLNDQLEEFDFRTNRELINLITNTNLFAINKGGFENLMSVIDESEFENKELLRKLKLVYVTQYIRLMTHVENLSEFVGEYNKYISEHYPWYAEINSYGTQFPEGRIQYQMNDPIYRNRVNRYRNIANDNKKERVYDFQINAAEIYKDIAFMLDQDTVPLLVNQYFESPPADIAAKLMGRYDNDVNDDIVSIFTRNDSLFISNSNTPEISSHIVLGKEDRFMVKENRLRFQLQDDTTLVNLHDRNVRVYKITE